ncbi:MAG: DNA polymerase III subunit gamma/tau [Clostridia bacterium]|nr:DNA polymerase III subunit gamma/tau [Clostridia bacterium]MBN2882815.1 DNA polymerase III subunit gamma/tau [Clostridia bacterium]
MSYKALYREWRPGTFEEVIEQEHVTRTLRNAVKSGRVAHAYLFCGTRGTGKTTMAYILSKAVNCLNPKNGDPCNKCSICTGINKGNVLDVIEMDAASNNSVDNIRAIRDEVAYTPAMTKFKVYIIDEVHMLSTGAFNALLKTLEEPPEHVIFILATTEPHKLPATVLSRCQRFDFHRITVDGIIERLGQILESKGIEAEDRALRIIARVANGAMRDAISILDQTLASGDKKITVEMVLESAGILQDEAAMDLAQALYEKNIIKVLEITDSVLMQGKSTSQFLSSLIFYYRNLLVCTGMDNPGLFIEGSDEIIDFMKKQADEFGREFIVYVIRELSQAESIIKRSTQPRTYLEVVLINISSMNITFAEQASMLQRISALEGKINRLKKIQAEPIADKPQPRYIEKAVVREPKPEQDKNNEKMMVVVKDFDWNKVIDTLNERGDVDVAPYLNGTAAKLENNVLSINFQSNFNKNFISKDRKKIQILKDSVDEMYGGDFEVSLFCDTSSSLGKNDFEDNARKAAEALGIKLEIE